LSPLTHEELMVCLFPALSPKTSILKGDTADTAKPQNVSSSWFSDRNFGTFSV